MPVRVNTPIRIVVDPHALDQRLPDIDEALSAALGRALENSHDAVVTERGGYVELVYHEPQFTWTGDGLDAVPDTQRLALQQHITGQIQQAISRSSLAQHDKIGADAPHPMPDDIFEQRQRQRYHRLLRLYELPSYDDDGDETAVPVEDDDAADERPPGGLTVAVWAWLEFQFAEIYDVAAGHPTPLAYSEYEIAEADFGSPNTELRGQIFLSERGLSMVIQKTSENRFFYLTSPLDSFTSWVFVGPDADPPWQQVNTLPPPDLTVARFHGPYEGSEAGRRRAIETHMREGMEEEVTQKFPNPNPRAITPEEHRQAIQNMVDRQVEARVRALPDTSFALVELQIGQSKIFVNMPYDAQFQWTGAATLLPIAYRHIVTFTPADEGEGQRGYGGTGRGTGRRDDGDSAGGDASGTGGQGTGTGGGDGDDGQRGGLVITGEGEGTGDGGLLYPVSPLDAIFGERLECESAYGEPSLEDLGDAAQGLQQHIDRIAFLLGIPTCNYAGRFLINAAHALGSRAQAVGEYAARESGSTEPVGDGTSGNLGIFNFVPVPSIAIQLLRTLASIVPDISTLAELVDYAYRDNMEKFEEPFTNELNMWRLRFLYDLNTTMKNSIAILFGCTCQTCLLQLLRSSYDAITARQSNIGEYARMFEDVILPEIIKVQDLIELRDILQRHQSVIGVSQRLRQVDETVPGGLTWAEASRLLLDAFTESSRAESSESGERGEIVVEDNVVRIFDGQGRLWTLEGLERAIAIHRGVIEAADPLVKQMVELDEVVARFTRPNVLISWELAQILYDMQLNNEEKTRDAEDDWMFAFRASRIQESLPQATVPGTSVQLHGIHMVAHEQIGHFFRGDGYYAIGLNYLFGAEQGRLALMTFFEFVGMTFLAVACPPLAAAVGIGLSVYHYVEAREREQLYESLIDPELVLTRAEVEAELFAAQLGLAFAFIPEVGGILGRYLGIGARAGTRVAGEAAEEVVEGATRSAFRAMRGYVLREMAQSLKHGVLVAFIREIATDQVMDLVVSKLIAEPIILEMQRELMTIGPGLGAGQAPAQADQPLPRGWTLEPGQTVTRQPDGSVTIHFQRQPGSAPGDATGDE